MICLVIRHLFKMKILFYILLLISVVYCHHGGGFIDTNMEKERHFYLLQDEDNNIKLINILQPALEIEVQYADITFYYYSRGNPNSAIKISGDAFNGIIDSEYFDPERVTFFLSHGYSDSHQSSGITRNKNALLEAEDCNVFIIDWSPISHEFYTTVVQAVPQIGSIIAACINKFVVNYNISLSKINLEAHSLGTHIMGSVGAHFNGEINSILGADPALPLFNHNDLDRRLDTTDAKFVQVIHTNGGLLGFKNAIGHADYYPNKGGMNQPNCGPDLFGNCAHGRATELYGESISNSKFRAVSCESPSDYEAGLCDNNPVSYMGGYSIDKEAHGKYYLKTAEYPPYALG